MKIIHIISSILVFLGSLVGCQSIELKRLDDAVASKPLNKNRCLKIVKDRTKNYQKSQNERINWIKKNPAAVFHYGECWILHGGNFTAGDSLERVAYPNLFATIYGQFENNNNQRKHIRRLEQETQRLEERRDRLTRENKRLEDKNHRLKSEKREVETEFNMLNRKLRGDTAHLDGSSEIVFP